MLSRILRNIRYAIEAVLLILGLAFFRILPLDMASLLAGIMARIIGPFSGAHRTAQKNLEMAMPELSAAQRRKILYGMWDNIGRVIGEYPHLSRHVMTQRITVEGLEHLQEAKYSGKAVLFVSGHFANWEIAPLTAALYGLPLVLLYRAANNPVADWVICKIRSYYNIAMYRKGREGAQEALKAIKEGHPIGMLIDQKMNDGKPIQFFGREAMTGTAATGMAIKFQVPVLVANIVRTDGVHFHVSIESPIHYDRDKDPTEAMQELHHIFEDWIRQHPAQWFWVHRRWGK